MSKRKELSCCYEIAAEAGCANDEIGNYCEAYLKYGIELDNEIDMSEEEMFRLGVNAREEIAEMVGILPEYLKVIDEETYRLITEGDEDE